MYYSVGVCSGLVRRAIAPVHKKIRGKHTIPHILAIRLRFMYIVWGDFRQILCAECRMTKFYFKVVSKFRKWYDRVLKWTASITPVPHPGLRLRPSKAPHSRIHFELARSGTGHSILYPYVYVMKFLPDYTFDELP